MSIGLHRRRRSDGPSRVAHVDAVLGLIRRDHEHERPITGMLRHHVVEVHHCPEPQRALAESGVRQPALGRELLKPVVVVRVARIDRTPNGVARPTGTEGRTARYEHEERVARVLLGRLDQMLGSPKVHRLGELGLDVRNGRHHGRAMHDHVGLHQRD